MSQLGWASGPERIEHAVESATGLAAVDVTQTPETKVQAGRSARHSPTDRGQLAVFLRRQEALSAIQINQITNELKTKKDPVIKLLLEKEWLTEEFIYDTLKQAKFAEPVDVIDYEIDPQVLDLVSLKFCEQQWLLPLKAHKRRLWVAMADPLDEGLIREVNHLTGLEVTALLTLASQLQERLGSLKHSVKSRFNFETLSVDTDKFEGGDDIEVVIDDQNDTSLDVLMRSSIEPPAIRLTNSIISDALRLGASDIHIQPQQRRVIVRYRIDGVLVDKIQFPVTYHLALVSRIKVMAELDIAERRRPQDGRIMLKVHGKEVDLRVSTLPTLTGEKVVMRVLDRQASLYKLENLLTDPVERAKIVHMISRPHGLILATGPTGSGKTTTLYALLQHDAISTKNYITLEDPVEYFLPMAGQVHVKQRIGMTFAKALRAVLRQDPDVILLGEIRDDETAEVALHAAMTGHLVYSTLHTNSAVSTVARLFDLGVKPYVVATSLEGIISQRLVRRICLHCKQVDSPNPLLVLRLGPLFQAASLSFYKGAGCRECFGTGYQGRIGLYEIFSLDDDIRDLISRSGSVLELDRLARQKGIKTLLEDARDKVSAGLTTAEEVIRVLGSQAVVTC